MTVDTTIARLAGVVSPVAAAAVFVNFAGVPVVSGF
jgi:hypothetical protein